MATFLDLHWVDKRSCKLTGKYVHTSLVGLVPHGRACNWPPDLPRNNLRLVAKR